MRIQELFDKATFTLTYVIWDETTRDAIVIDPVLDYEPATSLVCEESVAKVAAILEKESLRLHYILETHAHADHVSGAQALKARYPEAKVAIGARITEVQKTFKPVFALPDSFPTDGRQFDRLLADKATIVAGSLRVEARHTPGHTPACASYLVGDAVFTGDTLFMPDFGVGRCDFPGADARTLYSSVTRQLYTLPDETRAFTGHDYLPGGRPLRCEATIGEQKRSNIHLHAETTEEAFVKFRRDRDRTLKAPALLLPSVQINIAAGHLPPYLTIPISKKA